MNELINKLRHYAAITADEAGRSVLYEASDTIERLQAERDALKKDAERYRFLRSTYEGMGEEPDRAIDAAIAAKEMQP